MGATALAVALPAAVLSPASPAAAADAPAFGAPDAIAADYYAALLRHTRWTESVFDSTLGVYKAADFNFAVVLGNAVLVTHGDYDESLAGVSKATLRARTVATIAYYAARNRFVNPTGGTWGKQLFWDSTFQSYFLDAGKLLWDDLDATTQASLKTIAAGQAAYTAGLNYGDDPMSGSWTPEWPVGRFERDTAAEESGVYSQALAPGIAWSEDDASSAAWSAQFNDWVRNAVAQPTADANNPAVVGGKAISTNLLHNIYDTYVTENHNTVAPHYQSDLWRSGGRNSIQFILNGKPVPEIIKHQPNSAELWRSLQLMMSQQGEPFMSMNADREFLYGRDVIPLAFVGQVLRNPDAVRAEANMAASLAAYQAYAPVDRLAKFSGEPKYEPEARAEVAIAYLLHVAAAESDEGTVEPTPADQYFARLSGVRDYGDEPGLTVQQSEKSWAGASSRQGYVKFPWAPGHNPWLFQTSGATPFLYPTPAATVDKRTTAVYTGPRDGFDGTASLFTTGSSSAGQVTLPTGSAIYATSGAGREDGALTVRNLAMGGFAGLDGSRTYTTAEGSQTASLPVTRAADPLDVSAARVDNLSFAPVSARYVRMQGIQGNATFGYSMYAFHVYGADATSTTDLAAGRTATASSEDAAGGRQASKVTDATASTRWAVSTADRKRANSWIQVDLGSQQTVGGVRLAWEASAGTQYLVQTSDDGSTWTDQVRYGPENAADANAARVDSVALTPAGGSEPAPVQARYVRMQGIQGDAGYGYSLYNFRVYGAAGTLDLAAGKPATASSAASGNAATTVTDGSSTTRWAVSKEERPRADSWIQVDLGTAQDVAKVQLAWEVAAGRDYLIQTSLDGSTWTDAAHFRYTGDQITATDQGWLNVEGAAGFVVRGSGAQITVSKADDAHHVIRLADSPTTGSHPFLVEMLPTDAAGTAAEAAQAQPTVGADGVLASTLDGYLSLFNLTGADVTTDVTLPYSGETVSLFAGSQTLGADSSTLTVTVPARSSAVLAPRMNVARSAAAAAGLVADVRDARSVEVSSAQPATLDVQNVQTGAHLSAQVTDEAATLRFADATAYPVQDLALSTLTFPASVLPPGMTDPQLAVDGDATTSWVPGPDGRMVVDLGAARAVGQVALVWDGTDVPDAVVSTSDDGLTFHDVGAPAGDATTTVIDVDATVRYVAVSTQWAAGRSGLAAFRVLPPGVHQDLAPGAITGELPAWTVGTPATGSLSASGTPSVELTVTAGALPAGVTLHDGSFGGTPTRGGAFSFTVTAENGVGTPSTRTFTGTVGAMPTTLALTAAVATTTSGSLTATLEDSGGAVLTDVSGTVAFYASSTPEGQPLATVALVDGVASTPVTGLAPETTTHYSAVFTPAGAVADTYAGATSQAVTLTTGYDVVDSTTTATVSSVVVGTAPVASVSVSAGGAAAHGSVTVRVDEGAATTATLSGGAASVTLPSDLSAGTHTAEVTYLGDERTRPSSTAVAFTVSKAAATLSVTATSSTTYGKPATVQARVTALGAAATGSVRVDVDGKPVATKPLASGAASIALPSTLAVGRHTVRVEYLGSAQANEAVVSKTLTVTKAPTKVALALSSTAPSALTTRVKATVTVTVPGTALVAGGKVSVKVGGRTVSTVALSRGRATVTLPVFTTAGATSVTATFAGTVSLLPATSSAARVTVAKATTKVALALSSKSATAKKTKVRATVTVTVPGASVYATGRVAIKVDGKTVSTVSLSRGRATVVLPVFTRTGSKVAVTATYAGNGSLRSSKATAYIRVVR
ncbi:discoidin domain-containing protein [Cellulomonas edaphi]|uniref:Discoidin domain-containing protein n=1 Tax=Cellulomonas edaphi TaxID=3053468 RepID=A0ABT7S4S1_9CELL|nr:discoidin domain-containing protein [Cellulomons edaphi]MDM7830610.1 discoidin domain-containing protein [Cellulomons edaphi]